MARIFIVGSGAVGTTAGCLLSRMGHRVTFVDFQESGVRALRAQGHDACLANDIDREPGSFIFLASEDKDQGVNPLPSMGRIALSITREHITRGRRQRSA